MNGAVRGVPVVRLAARGDGVTVDGRFVPGAVPGDVVAPDGRVWPGPGRAPPVCRHFGACGGCRLQHVAEPELARYVRERCLEPLGRLGIRPDDVAPVHLSPSGARRRATLRAVRRGGRVELGFSAEGSHRLIDLAECPVLHPELWALVGPLRALLADLLPEGVVAGVTMLRTEAGPDLLLSNVAADRPDRLGRLADFARATGLARLSVEGPLGVETVVAFASPVVSLGGVPVVVPPGAFLQATSDGEAALVAAVAASVGAANSVADLFAGLGTFALPLSARARVHAVEGARAMCQALDLAARAAGRPIAVEHRDLFRRPLAGPELDRFEAVVIDPPRAGAQAQSQALARSRVPVVVAVSCNPATFARDAATLVAGGYRLARLWPVGQFRWSTAVELVARFSLC